MYESIVMVHAILREREANAAVVDRRAFHGPDAPVMAEQTRRAALLPRILRRTARPR